MNNLKFLGSRQTLRWLLHYDYYYEVYSLVCRPPPLQGERSSKIYL